MHRGDAVSKELSRIPDAGEFEGIGEQERARRALVLEGIRRRVVEDGAHRAVPSPERGRLFQPFAALKGYEEMVGDAEMR